MAHQSLQSFYTLTFEPLFLRSRSPHTKFLYQNSINHFHKFLSSEPLLDDLNDETVSRFLSWFRDLPRSPATVNKERSNLLAIWRFACRRQTKTLWPTVEKDIEPHTIPQAWSQEQLKRLLTTCQELTGSIGPIPADQWWTALHLTCWDTGERIGALRSLQWTALDLKQACFERVIFACA